jgi:hypothetical protein
MAAWEKRRILIWGKTRPELSRKYGELVCTGGVFEDSKRFVRLYPIPLRFMDDEHLFAKYNWIEAYVMKSSGDPRPESYRIRDDSIQVVGSIAAEGAWEERARWILHEPNLAQSVEQLQDRQQRDGTSLGLIKPRSVDGVTYVELSRAERDEFSERYEEVTRQMFLPGEWAEGRDIRPLRAPDFRFKVSFTCDDSRCSGHDFSVLDWEIDALYFRQRKTMRPAVAADATVDHLRRRVLVDDRDRRLFLGNIASYPNTFTIVGFWYPRNVAYRQQSLL